jgi:hypothetical protein
LEEENKKKRMEERKVEDNCGVRNGKNLGR